MDFVALISSTVESLSAEPTFYHGPESLQNVQDDVNIETGIVFLDEPIISNDDLKKSGYLEETYPARLLFAKKSEEEWTTDQHQTVIQECREMRREFINRLSKSKSVQRIDNIRTIDVMNLLDLNVSGCYLQIDITPFNLNSNCLT